METRNRIEIMLDAIATATPIDNPRDRLEVFISAIASALANAGETNDIEPRDRIELLLDAIADAIGDAGLIVAESLSVTENGTYTAPSGKAYTPVTVNVPTTTIESLSVTENGTYTAPEGKSYTPVTVNVPLPQNAVLLKSITGLPQNVASFTDGANAPLNDLELSIVSAQAGTGDPSPENVRAISGWSSATISNFSINQWDEVWELGGYSSVNGTKASFTDRIRSVNKIAVIKGATYKVVMPTSSVWIYQYNSTGTYLTRQNVSANGTYTVPEGVVYIALECGTSYGTTYENNISINYPSTDTEYHAYSGHTLNLSFGTAGTVYGGSLNVTTGLLTITDANIASYDGETLPSTWISSMDVYSAEATPTTGAQVVYKLETPTTVQLTPTQIRSLLGVNNIYADCGQITDCEYFAKAGE